MALLAVAPAPVLVLGLEEFPRKEERYRAGREDWRSLEVEELQAGTEAELQGEAQLQGVEPEELWEGELEKELQVGELVEEAGLGAEVREPLAHLALSETSPLLALKAQRSGFDEVV